MSSNESSGAPAEATATTPAPSAAFPSFGSTRGSGLARGKRPSTGPVSSSTAVTPGYTPTAIEVVTAPREYQNPFAPANPEPVAAVEAPVAVTPAPVAVPAPVVPVEVSSVTPVMADEPVALATTEATAEEPAELNILPPERPKVAPAQTWESEGFRPAREPRNDHPRREERQERAPRERDDTPFDPSTIPAKFLYVRPGYNYVPTPSNYGGAPRERDHSAPVAAPHTPAAPRAPIAETAPKSGGFIGWLKSLFAGAPAAAAPTETRTSESSTDSQRQPGRPRGGRGRGQSGGGQYSGNGEGQRRHRGGRGRGQRGGEYRGGGDQGGSSAT